MSEADALVAFLCAQLDEDERVAKQASYGLDLHPLPDWTARFEDERDPETGRWRQRWAVVAGNYVVRPYR